MDSTDERVRRAVALAKAGKTTQARAELVTLVKSNEDNAAAWAALAQLADIPKDAAYCLNQVLRIQPDNQWAKAHLQRLSQQEAPPDQISQIDHEIHQQDALAQADMPPRLPTRLVLSAAGVLILLCLLGGLLIIQGGLLPDPFALATGAPTLTTGTTPSTASTPDPIFTPQTNPGPGTSQSTEGHIEPGNAATQQATGSARPTGTRTAQPTTSPLASSPTLPPTEAQALTPTDYPTPTDPPQPPDVPTDQPPPAPAPCDCYGASLTCRDFDTQVESQACYDYCLQEMDMDISFLDSNQNGIACENLP